MGSITAIPCDSMPEDAPIRFHVESTLAAPLQRLWAFYMFAWRHHVSRRAARDLVCEETRQLAAAGGLPPPGGLP